MANRVITIGREFGSGGRKIGRLVAEKLEIPCYDAEIINKIAEESGYDADYIKEESEFAGGWFSPWFYDRSLGLSNQDKLWIMQSKIITELAEKSSCVIVGRCADYILRDKVDCLKVFVHAALEKRAERVTSDPDYAEGEGSPEQRIKDKDKRRATYYRFYTDMKWGRTKNYHICLDSGEIGIDKCVDIIAELY